MHEHVLDTNSHTTLKHVTTLYPIIGRDLQVEKNAVPSLFKIFPPSLQNHGIPEETRSPLQMPEKCPSPKCPTRKRHIIDE